MVVMMTISSDVVSGNSNGNGSNDCNHANARTRNIRKRVTIMFDNINFTILVVCKL